MAASGSAWTSYGTPWPWPNGRRHAPRGWPPNPDSRAPPTGSPPSTGHRPPPRPAARRPVERYADGAVTVAGAAFAGTLAVTRGPLRAAGAAVSAIPKAPWVAREAFTSVLCRGLARRGALVTDPGGLRRLDRIDTVVLDTDTLVTGVYVLSGLVPLDTATAAGEAAVGGLAAVAHRLFDGKDPARECGDGEWLLARRTASRRPGPPGRGSAPGWSAPGPPTCSGSGARAGCSPWSGWRPRSTRPRAPWSPRPAGRGCGCWPPGTRAATGAGRCRRRRRGRRPTRPHRTGVPARRGRGAAGVVAAGRARRGRRRVGVTGLDEAPPWGAHLHVGGDPAWAVVVVEACGVARTVARRGVRLAQGPPDWASRWPSRALPAPGLPRTDRRQRCRRARPRPGPLVGDAAAAAARTVGRGAPPWHAMPRTRSWAPSTPTRTG
ncbi:hypothetical protein NKH77_54305 [Streptomyces sp. M19]